MRYVLQQFGDYEKIEELRKAISSLNESMLAQYEKQFTEQYGASEFLTTCFDRMKTKQEAAFDDVLELPLAQEYSDTIAFSNVNLPLFRSSFKQLEFDTVKEIEYIDRIYHERYSNRRQSAWYADVQEYVKKYVKNVSSKSNEAKALICSAFNRFKELISTDSRWRMEYEEMAVRNDENDMKIPEVKAKSERIEKWYTELYIQVFSICEKIQQKKETLQMIRSEEDWKEDE